MELEPGRAEGLRWVVSTRRLFVAASFGDSCSENPRIGAGLTASILLAFEQKRHLSTIAVHTSPVGVVIAIIPFRRNLKTGRAPMTPGRSVSTTAQIMYWDRFFRLAFTVN